MPDARSQHAVFLALMARFEATLRRQVIKDKRRFINGVAAEYARMGALVLHDNSEQHRDAILKTLAQSYRRIIPAFGRMAMAQVKSLEVKADYEEDLYHELTLRWLNEQGLKRSKQIADTTEADVLAALAEGLEEGLGTAAIARRIRKVTTLSPFRADLIARTETHAAATYASVETVRNAEQTLGVRMLKEWLPTLDSRTRESHAAMAATSPIPMDDKFDVGGEMMDRPGDPTASAENVINCRCTLAYSEMGDASP